MAPTTFMGGKLKLKGDDKDKKKKKARKKTNSSKHTIDTITTPAASANEPEDDGLTEAERKGMKFKLDKQMRDLEKVTSLSHRQRVEQFNEDLSKLSEHNDIPRVSAAGNGQNR